MQKPFVTALIIPTGVGASIGGYAGDASSLLPLFASISDTLITHPNVANAACFQNLPSNALYVEGYALDQFFKHQILLSPVHQNKIGVILDAGIEGGMKILHRNTVNAVKTTYGVSIVGVIETDEPLGLQLLQTDTGRSTGEVNNLETLFKACEKLITQGATALAICSQMPPLPETENKQYQSGQGVDPIAGIEAMISHAVVAQFGLPAANAPVFTWEEAEPVKTHLVDVKSAAEFIVPTFLPCVLQGLNKAPQLLPLQQQLSSKSIKPYNLGLEDLSALVIPESCLGNVPVLACLENNTPVLAVKNNTTVMQADYDTLGLNDVYLCENYMEALGLLLAIKQGIQLPSHIFESRISSTLTKQPLMTTV